MNKQLENEQIYLGVDGGGTKCRVILYTQEQGVLAESVSGPANAARSIEKAKHNIVKATDDALAKIGLAADFKSNLIAGIGLAGLNLAACMREMRRWDAPFKQVFYSTDLHISCIGAHQGNDGAVMIIGTGSSGLVVAQGEKRELGGHGFPVGDCGSGAWLGFKGIEYSLLSLDGINPETPFVQAVLDVYQVSNANDLAQKVSGFSANDFAKLAPVVMDFAEAGDAIALDIVNTGAAYLSSLAEQLLAGKDLPIALIGGVSSRIVNFLQPQIIQHINDAAEPPEIGAVRFAIEQSKN